MLFAGNLIFWKSKKQNVVVRFSAEAEYKTIAMTTCQLVWLKQLVGELAETQSLTMKLFCDN